MNSLGADLVWLRGAVAAASAIVLLELTCATLSARSQEFAVDAGWRNVNAAEYRQHLQDLDAIVAACQKQRAIPGAPQKSDASKPDFPACDPAQIGADDRVEWSSAASSQAREVRYDWLRNALARAATRDGAKQASIIAAIPGANNKAATVDQILSAVRLRLQDDEKQSAETAEINPDYTAERQSLNAILAQRAYQGVNRVSARERFIEWFDNLLDRFFAGLVRFSSRAPWIAWVLRVLVLGGICTALIWFLIRIEQRSRVRLIPDNVPVPGAPSAREWQLWLRDAQTMAAKGLWREAIHFLYWATIARLESKRLRPADRACTPREYLALLAGTDPRKPSLAALTGSFERTWYGGRAAAAADFNVALEQAAALGVAAE